MMFRRLFRVLALPGVLTLALAGPALAQFGGGNAFRGLSQSMEPEFTGRDIGLLVKTLELDESQREVVLIFISEYETAFRAASEKFRDQQTQFRRDAEERVRGAGGRFDWRASMETLRTMQEEFETERRTMGASTLESIKSVLLPSQEDQWPLYLQSLRRKNSIPGGLLSGESVDLFLIVDQSVSDVALRERARPHLDEYAGQLDVALKRRDDDMDRLQDDITEAMRGFDLELARKSIDRQRALRVRIREINENHARLIAEELPDPFKAAFEDAVRRAAFPTVYRDSWGQMSFKAAQDLPGIAVDLRAVIAELAEEFDDRLRLKNESLERVLREEEPKVGERMINMASGMLNGTPPNFSEDPINAAFNGRSDLERLYVKRLHDMLGEEQVAMLPRDPGRPDPQRGGFGGIGGFGRGGGDGGRGGGRGTGGRGNDGGGGG